MPLIRKWHYWLPNIPAKRNTFVPAHVHYQLFSAQTVPLSTLKSFFLGNADTSEHSVVVGILVASIIFLGPDNQNTTMILEAILKCKRFKLHWYIMMNVSKIDFSAIFSVDNIVMRVQQTVKQMHPGIFLLSFHNLGSKVWQPSLDVLSYYPFSFLFSTGKMLATFVVKLQTIY